MTNLFKVSKQFILDSYDWKHIFSNYALPTNVRSRKPRARTYSAGEIKKVVAAEEGENDGPNWIGVFEMEDGKFLVVRAGCDYTGWGCQESGNSDYASTLGDAIKFGLTAEERTRLDELLPRAYRQKRKARR